MSKGTWQVHRFRDKAGAYLGDGATCYLTAKEARRMAKALNAVARSIEREEFSASAGLTATGTTVYGHE